MVQPELNQFVLGGVSNLATLRGWIRRWRVARWPGMPEAALHDVLLVSNELATNALEHADGPRTLQLSRAAAALDGLPGETGEPGAVLVEVTDASPGVAVTPGRSSNPYGGRGLRIVAAVASWGVHRDGVTKTLWARVPILAAPAR